MQRYSDNELFWVAKQSLFERFGYRFNSKPFSLRLCRVSKKLSQFNGDAAMPVGSWIIDGQKRTCDFVVDGLS